MGTKRSKMTAWPVGFPKPSVRMGIRSPESAAERLCMDEPPRLAAPPLYSEEARRKPPWMRGFPEFMAAGLAAPTALSRVQVSAIFQVWVRRSWGKRLPRPPVTGAGAICGA